jgi:metal-responsive CopG/Arc/MetJ family transcriptional regulator
MAKKRITVELPVDIRQDLDRFAGPRGRSRFVAEAVNEAVEREQIRKGRSEARSPG